MYKRNQKHINKNVHSCVCANSLEFMQIYTNSFNSMSIVQICTNLCKWNDYKKNFNKDKKKLEPYLKEYNGYKKTSLWDWFGLDLKSTSQILELALRWISKQPCNVLDLLWTGFNSNFIPFFFFLLL
jgi:hypothetical protein